MSDEHPDAATRPVKVVICGAGPAGLLFAHCLMAWGEGRFRIRVYDKAEDPRNSIQKPMSYRRYSIGLSKRAENCFKLVPGLLEKVKEVVVNPDVIAVFMGFGKAPVKSSLKREDAKSSWVVDRVSLCSNLLASLLEQHKDSAAVVQHLLTETVPAVAEEDLLLQVKFNCSCISVDLEKHTASFLPSSTGGETPELIHESYDLLVGADGLHSTVRMAFQQHIRGFEVEQRALHGWWQVTHFPIPAGFTQGTLHLFPVVPRSGGINGLAIPSPDGTLCFIWTWLLNDDPSGWLACSTPDEAHAFIASRLPYFHVPKEAAWKLCCTPPQTSMYVKCWQYHDVTGRAVIIGDAAHATSPSIGQGCNASLVDACVLARLITGEWVTEDSRAPFTLGTCPIWQQHPTPGQIRRKLPDLLHRFSALQVKEGHALVDLSNASGPLGKWARAIHGFLFFLRSMLNKMASFIFLPPIMSYAATTSLPYSAIYEKFKIQADFFNLWNEKVWRECEERVTAEIVGKGIVTE